MDEQRITDNNVSEQKQSPRAPVPLQSVPEKKERSGTLYFLWEVIKFALISLIIVAPIRLFIASPFIVSGASMEPTFDTGHYLIIDQISYRFHPPKRGEIIVFRYPNDPSKFFIKRIIGLPGETVRMTNGAVSIINEESPGGILLSEPYIAFPQYDTLSTTLGENEYFVLGDNRKNSSDSRAWGTLPGEYITGRAFLKLFPLGEIGAFPGFAYY